MSIERIAAVVHAPAARPRDDGGGPRTSIGETLRLAFVGPAGADDLLVSDGKGFSLRLLGLAQRAPDLTPGDVLLLRVLATAPRLELEFLGTAGVRGAGQAAASGAPAQLTDQAAMRLDQTAMQRISLLLPEAATLALAWYMRVRERGAPLAAAMPQGALALLAAPAGAQPGVPHSPGAERLAFPVFAWGGLPALLWLVPAEEEPGRRGRRRRALLALRIELALPVLGPVAVQVVSEGADVTLALVVEREGSVQAVREAIPAIAAALAKAGMRLAKCSITRGRVGAPAPEAREPTPEEAAAITPGPFRAVAEVIVVLLANALAAEFSRASR